MSLWPVSLFPKRSADTANRRLRSIPIRLSVRHRDETYHLCRGKPDYKPSCSEDLCKLGGVTVIDGMVMRRQHRLEPVV